MFCNITSPSGNACVHLSGSCPLHTPEPAVTEPPATDAEPETAEPRDPRVIGRIVVERVLDENASPIQAARFLRTLRSLDAMGDLPEDQERVLKEIELRGVVMNGFPPRNEEEWALAREVFDDDAIAEFERWIATGHGW